MTTSSAGYGRPLGWLLGIAMILATILLLAVNLNLITKPPEFPSSATLVDRLLGSQDFRHAVWPFDLASNLLLCLGLVAAIPLAWLISAGLDGTDGRRALIAGPIVSGAIWLAQRFGTPARRG